LARILFAFGFGFGFDRFLTFVGAAKITSSVRFDSFTAL